MLDNRIQFRGAISAALNKINFYYLPLTKLTEILRLLQMPQTSESNAILQYVYTGITRLYDKHKQKIGNHIFNQKYSSISKEAKDLVYTIFVSIHNILLANQQNIMHSAPISPYNMEMYYSQPPASGFSFQESNYYAEQMKKYLDALKAHPYNLMSPQINPYFNPNLNPNLISGLNPQFGIPIHAINPYMMSYPNNSSIGLPYGQLKNPPRTMPPNSIPFGMNPYSATSGIPSIYPQQYMNPYSQNMIGGHGQSPSSSFTQMMGLEKNNINSKLQQAPGSIINNDIEKRFSSSQGKPEQTNKNEKQKNLQKESKQIPHPYKLANNLPSYSYNKVDHNKIKPNIPIDLLNKQLPSKDSKKPPEQNPLYKACTCKGYSENDTSFSCSICKNKFHYRCLSLPEKPEDFAFNQIACAHCKMRTMDPLNKVEEIIGEFYLINLFEKSFQVSINFKLFQAKCRQKNSKFQIEVRCIRAGQHMKNLEITWPDQCQIKINGQKIVDIPALQSNSSLKKRKDYSVFITQNIYSKALPNSQFSSVLDKTKILLELKPFTAQEASTKRIRNDFTFALGIYLIEKLNTDELYAKVMSEQKCEDKNFLKNLMKTSENEVQIDKITIRLIDPYSWDQIRTPVRGYKCTHAQCFDLKTFISLMFSAKNRTWRCPLCSKDSRKFMLDNEQMDLIKKAQQFQPIPKQVSIYKQGKVAFKIEIDSDDEDEAVSTVPKTKKIMKEKKEEVIKQK